MMDVMKCRAFGFFSSAVLVVCACSGQTTIPPGLAHYVEIKLPPAVPSESFFVRYVLAGDDLGGWVRPVSGVSSYIINTAREGVPATGIKAVLYAPGCAIQTLDLSLSNSANPHYSFVCQPVPSVLIAGTLVRSDRLYGREVKLQAKYVARWAARFLGLDESVVTFIPMGDSVKLTPDGLFKLMVPDLSQDPVAGSPDHAGELQIWATDQTGETVVAELVPIGVGILKTQMGGLRVQRRYPSQIVFVPCLANPAAVYDRETGFAIRPGPYDACDR